jgi:hypothetical protein
MSTIAGHAEELAHSMPQSAPRTPREVFELFRNYDDARDIDGLLEQVDWAGVAPHQIYWATLGPLPESASVCKLSDPYSARAHAKAAVLSEEFQRSSVTLIANAFPERRRLIHVHIY